MTYITKDKGELIHSHRLNFYHNFYFEIHWFKTEKENHNLFSQQMEADNLTGMTNAHPSSNQSAFDFISNHSKVPL